MPMVVATADTVGMAVTGTMGGTGAIGDTVTTITITVTDQSMADQVADTIHQSMVTEFRSIAQLHTTAVPASESRPQDSVSTFGNRGQDVHMIHYPKKQAEELMVLRLLSFLFV